MTHDIIERAKNKGYRVAVSKKGFTREGFKYRITRDKDLMYGDTLDDIAYLTGIKKEYPEDKKGVKICKDL